MLALPPLFSHLLTYLVLFLYSANLSLGTIQTATIDDALGDSQSGALPIYSPPSSFSPNSDCGSCKVHADPAQAFDGTWHDSSQFRGKAPVSVTLSFTGTSINVFCILANTIPGGAGTRTDLAFLLDGSPQAPFSHRPDSTSGYLYNQNVLSVSGLAQASHRLVVSSNLPPDANATLMLFDYAQYTFDDGVSEAPPSPPPRVTTTTTSVATSTTTTNALLDISTVTRSASSPVITISSFTRPSSSASTNPSASFKSSSPANTPPTSTFLRPLPLSSTSSLPAAVRATGSPSKVNLAAVLAGTLIPVFLVVLGCVVLYRRRRARHLRNPDPGLQSRASRSSLFGPANGGYDTGSVLYGDSSEGGAVVSHPTTNYGAAMSVFLSGQSASQLSGGDEQAVEVSGRYNTSVSRRVSALPLLSSGPVFQPSVSRSPSEYTSPTSPPPVYEADLPTLPAYAPV
ncbi:hypothetical protein B0H15DRAFT_35317 [Mycena belliarum]|uniref:Uncharacterized protein n=1 Tax=Mycena belliarum TaxID=1033014 RepID=A0AAD6UAQ7_9AGAR|nr:hypothetical protein B0H15DRAFT_35317 [Mycena belliae]